MVGSGLLSLGFQPWIAGGNLILDFNGVWLPFGLAARSRGPREATEFLILLGAVAS